MKTRVLIFVIAIALIAGGGYLAYDYVKEKPPQFLIKLFTKTDPPPPLPEGDVAPFTVPTGFSATVFARDIEKARVLTRDPKGTLLVSQALEEGKGKVVALPDVDGDQKADRVVTVVEGLNQPHGITVICNPVGNPPCTLYVAETDTLMAYTYDAETMSVSDARELATFPSGDGHSTRTVLPAHDNKGLFISVGSSCNVCDEEDPMRATIQFFDIATSRISTYATGLRNSVFMAWNPVSGDLWATDNGRDLIGDDIPPDEVNIIRMGKNYGWPLCYGQNIHDTDFDKKKYIQDPCKEATPPVIEVPAHSAALGLAFIPEEGWPDGWGNDLLVAYHGSWNRSVPTGYKIVRFDLDDQGKRVGTEDFMTGFIPIGATDTDEVLGRPVGLLAEPGGALYVSDDRQGAIYRVFLTEPAR